MLVCACHNTNMAEKLHDKCLDQPVDLKAADFVRVPLGGQAVPEHSMSPITCTCREYECSC